jgi:hypothetical protein
MQSQKSRARTTEPIRALSYALESHHGCTDCPIARSWHQIVGALLACRGVIPVLLDRSDGEITLETRPDRGTP